MNYNFLQSVHIQGKDYRRGVNEVSENVEKDALFLKYVSLGLILECDQQKAISLETPKERAEKLLNKLMDKNAPKVEKAPEELAPEAEEKKSPKSKKKLG